MKGDLWGKSKTKDSGSGGFQTQFRGLYSISFISIKHKDAAAQSKWDTSISGPSSLFAKAIFRK